MSAWHWMCCTARDIERLGGEEVYKQYGQQILDYLKSQCSENWEIVRYPEDEEVVKAINEIVEYYNHIKE